VDRFVLRRLDIVEKRKNIITVFINPTAFPFWV
jgi:hypothetical protein